MEGEAIEPTPLSELADWAIEFIDRLEEEYPDGFELGEIMIVAEVTPADDETRVDIESSEVRQYVAKSILKQASNLVESGVVSVPVEDEDEDGE